MTIFKYVLEILPEQILSLSENFQAISVHEQDGKISLWAIVDPSQPMRRKVPMKIVGTGQHLTEDFLTSHIYIGSVVMSDKLFVWHVFAQVGE